jgi:hypothetical protein
MVNCLGVAFSRNIASGLSICVEVNTPTEENMEGKSKAAKLRRLDEKKGRYCRATLYDVIAANPHHRREKMPYNMLMLDCQCSGKTMLEQWLPTILI